MKILQINNHHELRGGSEKVYHETIELLKKNGHQVYYFSTDTISGKTKKTEEGLLLQYIDRKKGNALQKIKGLKKFIDNEQVSAALSEYMEEIKPDIVHLHIFYGVLSNGILKSLKKKKIPVVMSVHEYRMLCPAYTFLNGENEICEKCQAKYYYKAIKYKCLDKNIAYSAVAAMENYYRDFVTPYEKSIDRFIMVSNFINQKHLQYKPAIRGKTEVIYNFLNMGEYRFQQKPDGDYLLYFGRLSKEKGILTLIRSLMSSGYKLKILGTGPEKEKIQEKIKGDSEIELLGFKTGVELKDLIANAKYTVVPSEWYENNPLSVIESLALGTPVIGAEIGGIPEIVIEIKTGFLFESRSSASLQKAIEKALSLSEEDYLRLRQKAREFAVENFSSNTYYSKLMETYNIVLKQKE